MVKMVLAGVVAGMLAVVPAAAGEREGGLADQPSIGQPLKFRNADGGSFRPSELVLLTDLGAVSARLPRTADAQSEDRVDLSSTPLVGDLFRGTLSTCDAREGALVGAVYRVGDRLVVDAAGFPEGLTRAPVAVATNLPRLGAVSYDLGYLKFGSGPALRPAGEPVGSAHIVNARLVIASIGGEAAYPSVEALFRDLFE